MLVMLPAVGSGRPKPGTGAFKIAAVQQMNATLILIIGRQAKQFERVCFDTERGLNDVGNL